MKRALVALGAALAAGAAALVWIAAGDGGAHDEAPRLRILAAASLTEALPRIDTAPAYEFGGSNRLAFQLRQGAAGDVFAAASPEFTQALHREGIVERPIAFASNRLVLVVPRSNPAGIRSVLDLRRSGVKLVVGTERVPVGSYTRTVLRRLGLAGVLRDAVSREPDVKGIVGKVALAQADAGFVYATDVRPVADRLRAIAIPARAQPVVRYEVAVVSRSRHRDEARAWVRRLTADARARRLLREAGFGLP